MVKKPCQIIAKECEYNMAVKFYKVNNDFEHLWKLKKREAQLFLRFDE
jgi:hypothetical protein